MSNEELALAIQAGQQELLPELWEQVRRLCHKITSKYQETAALNGAYDRDDLMQEAYLGMVEAVQRFDPSAGAFTTILDYSVRKGCRALLGLRGRRRDEHYNTASLDAPLADSEAFTLQDTLADDTLPGMTDQLELEDLQRDVRQAVDKLPERMKDVTASYYLQGEPTPAIAERLGTTRQNTNQIRQEALRRLRRDPELAIYEQLNFYRQKGTKAYRSSGSSVVEDLVLQLEQMREQRRRWEEELRKRYREEMIAHAWGLPAPARSNSQGPA